MTKAFGFRSVALHRAIAGSHDDRRRYDGAYTLVLYIAHGNAAG